MNRETQRTDAGAPARPVGTEHIHGAHVERYSLATALSLIVGISIGSGIFFKSDNILIATGGNVALGVAMFLLAATTIVFGGLTLARFASQTAAPAAPSPMPSSSWARTASPSSAGTSPSSTCPS